MARKKTTRKTRTARKAPASAPPPRGTTDRDKAVDALMTLLAERPLEDIGLAEVAGQAGLKLSQLRAAFGSVMAIYAAHVKDIDRKVLDGSDAELEEEPARERLFDVLMRRLEAMEPYKDAVRSVMRSARRHPGLAMALNAWPCARSAGCWRPPASPPTARAAPCARKVPR